MKYWRAGLMGGGIGGVMLLVFWSVFTAQYLNYDDPVHVVNDLFATPWRIFFTPDSACTIYVPLSMISFYIEQIIFKSNPYAAHVINFLIHAGVVLLVYRLACRLGLKKAAAYIAALIFAVHPMHVESVAWVSERKDLLYSVFYLGAVLFYCSYVEQQNRRAYFFALVCGLASALSKPMALSLPLVLFLIDHIKGRKFTWASVLDKLPFFVIIEPLVLITYVLNSRDMAAVVPGGLALWAWCGAFYINTFFWPVHLLPVYGAPALTGFPLAVYIILPAAGGVVAWMIGGARARPWLVFAFLFYILSTFFVWRFDTQDLNVVADRYMYLPSLGFCLLAGFVLNAWLEMSTTVIRKYIFFGFAAVLLLLLAGRACQQVQVWDNGFRFWGNILKDRPDAAFALKGRIRAALLFDPLFDRGVEEDIKKTVDQRYWKRLAGSPEATELAGRKVFYLRQLSALRDLKALGRAKGDKKDYYHFLAVAHENLDRRRHIMSQRIFNEYSLAINLDAKDSLLYFSRGLAALRMKNDAAALKDALMAVKLEPKEPTYYDLAVFCAVRSGNYRLAMALLDIEAVLFPDKVSVPRDRVKIDRWMSGVQIEK